MSNFKSLLITILLIASTCVNAQTNIGYVDGDNEYWMEAPRNFTAKGIPSCKALIAVDKNIQMTFYQYQKSFFKGTIIVPPNSNAKKNPSAPGNEVFLANDRKSGINNFTSFSEANNVVTFSYMAASSSNNYKSPVNVTLTYRYEPNKNVRYWTSLTPSEFWFKDSLKDAQSQGMPGIKEIKCSGPL